MKLKRANVTAKLWEGVLWGATISFVVTLLLCMVIAVILNNEKMAESNVGYGVLVILHLASYMGSYTACRMVGKQRLMVGLLTGATYFGTMMIVTAIAFGGEYHGISATVMLILCGNILAAMWTSRDKTKGKRRKLKISNG